MENSQQPITEGHSKRIIKKIRTIALWIFGIALTIILSAAILAYIYSDKIIGYAIQQLNTYLQAELYVKPENISFSIIKNFPNAGITFKEVKLMDATNKKKKGTLFVANAVSFQFNVMDIFNEKYVIKYIDLQGAEVNIKIDSYGNDNFHFLKPDTSTATGNFSFQLQKINLKKLLFIYSDDKSNVYFNGNFSEAELSGNFYQEKYELNINAKTFTHELKIDSTVFLSEKTVTIATKMKIDNNSNVYAFSEGGVTVGSIPLKVNGWVENGAVSKVELKISADNADIVTLFSLLPEKYNAFSEYKSEGVIDFVTTIKGVVSNSELPVINADFKINDGELLPPNSNVRVKHIFTQGKLYYPGNTKKAYVNIKELTAAIGGGDISGSFSIDNFSDPYIKAQAKATIDLLDLIKFYKPDTIEHIGGILKMNASFAGKIPKNTAHLKYDLQSISSSGTLDLKNVNLKLKNSPNIFQNIEGSFYFKGNDLGVNSFNGKISESDFRLSGIFKNLFGYFLFDNQNMTIDAGFQSDLLNLDELLASSSSENKSDYELVFPDRIDLKLKTSVEKIIFRKFIAENISGNVLLKDRMLVADPIRFSSMNGKISGAMMIDASRTNNILLTCDATLNQINITSLFSDFENFGQTYLVDKHLKGNLYADVQFATVCNDKLQIDLNKVYALCDITINNGELIGFSPFIEIAADLKKDKILNKLIDADEFEKKLKHIRFSTLTNRIEIKKNTINVPPMLIKSSAMDIDFNGWHKFNNDIEYHFSFLLSQIMTKNEKRRQEENKEFGEEEKDNSGRMLYYTMSGNVDNPVFKKDYQAKKEKRKEDIKKEKETLKQILNEEFGWFKKDSTINKKKKEDSKGKGKFILKWDEEKDEPESEEEF